MRYVAGLRAFAPACDALGYRMLRRLPLVPLLLSALIAVTSVTMAAARGQMMRGDAVVICSGYGVVTILVDARGEPVGTVHPCPDCTLHHVLADLVPAPMVLRPATRGEALRAAALSLPVARARVAPMARGPPAV